MQTKKSAEVIIVGVSFDDNYLYAFFVLAYSLKKNASMNFKIIIANVNTGIQSKNIDFIKSFLDRFEIDFEIIDFHVDFQLQKDNFSIAAYGRCFLMEKLQKNFLYLDVDSVAHFGWDQFIDDAIRTDRGWHAVQATVEPDSLYYAGLPRFQKNQARQKAKDTYLFAMMLIVNVKKIREIGFSRAWREAAGRYSEFGFEQFDQDVLNYVLAGIVKPLDSNVNHLHGTPRQYPIYFSSCISNPKPWVISPEEQIKILGLWTLGFSDLGKEIWLEDFSEYWSYEKALISECESIKSNEELATQLINLRLSGEKAFLGKLANIKWNILKSIYSLLSIRYVK
jgi:lipopolysaccharide biosynthesis glycosyltransferase